MKRFLSFLAVCLFVLASCEPEPVLSLDKEAVEFGENGGSQTIAVTANNTWNVVADYSSSIPFYSVSPTSGTENGFFTIKVEPNTRGVVNGAKITVVCTSRDMSVSKVVHITQNCAVGRADFSKVVITTLSGDEAERIPAEGGRIKMEIEANSLYKITCDAADVTVATETGAASATVPASPAFEGRDITFTLTCNTQAGGSTVTLTVKQDGGVFVYGGETYQAVQMKDGKWWMAENLRYIPSGMSPSDDATNVGSGIWYPLVIDVLDENTASVKFSTDASDIKANGYLYSTEVALGLKPGDITVDNAGDFEGVKGICPSGWHIPTKADILGLVGKTADKNDTNADAPYYDAELNGGNGSAAMLNADGFNAGAWGAVSIANAAAVKGTTMGAIKAYQGGMNTGYIAGSSMRQVTTNDDGSLKNVQYVALMPNMNNGTYNGAWNNYRNGVSVRCVKDN